ncbi:MAG: SdrD B-like domain-containing protein [Candidatus Eisenbacteria bacterium]
MRSRGLSDIQPRTARAGFTLVELMITLVLLALVMAVIATVMISSQRSKADTEGRLEAQQSGRAIADLMTADIRTAGYETDTDAIPPQQPFAYVDSLEIMINTNITPFPDTLGTRQDPRALKPDVTPRPHNLTGAYLPTSMYTTGAETIVYTLDLNNDGVVDAADQAVPLAAEAQRTGNPNDFVLARASYGYVAGGSNGGSLEKVGLVRGPGSGIPAMFTVYLNSSATPWNWSSGPIPANRLQDITSIKLRVTTEGRRSRPDGSYPRSTLTTEINSLRNTPNALSTQTLYHVTGYVFKDTNKNMVKDGGEPGIANVILRLGSTSVVQTGSSGYYDISGPPAAYLLRQSIPPGYGAFGPDSLAIDWNASPGNIVYSFADTALNGAFVNDTCYVDDNSNGVCDVSDSRVPGATVSAGSNSTYSGGDGGSSMFLPSGAVSFSVSPPDSYTVVSTNPVSITVVNGVNQTLYTRMSKSGTGTVTGYVYKDTNKNGSKDGGEAGIANVWVGVTSNSGANVLGFAVTDANGLYSIIVPNNMPAAVTPYAVTFVPPDNYYPTSATAISPIWLTTGQTISGQDFGVVNFVAFGLFADRVLALGTANLMEKDWSGNANQWASKGSYDQDLILCSEYVSNPNISVWFNNMASTPVFDSLYTYQSNAQSSALSIATGQIDTSTVSPNVLVREDAVTGLAYKASGNIAVWLNQNGSGNEGHFFSAPQLYMTADLGDVTQVALHECTGSLGAIDMIVGTKSPTSYTGTLEVWKGSGTGTFTRDEIYPPNGSLPGNALGEVKALLVADVNGDGYKDLIVGTRTGDGTGKIHVLRYVSRAAGARYVTLGTYSVAGEVNALAMTDLNGDGYKDIIVGTRVSSTKGDVQYWKGNAIGTFTYASAFQAPGPVLCLTVADMGGASKEDIIYGFRDNESAFTGGVRILYTELYALPPDDVDPAGGTSSYMTTSIAAWNFNYRLNNTTAGPYYLDLAVAQKPTSTTGRLLVYIR